MFLPAYGKCSMKFLQSITYRQKLFLYQKNVNTMRVPCWEEMSMLKMWPQACNHPQFRQYMPEDYFHKPGNRDRTYFWGVIATLLPDWVDQLIRECRQKRDDNRRPAVVHDFSNLDDEWREFLLDEPFQSRARAGCHSTILIRNQQPRAPHVR